MRGEGVPHSPGPPRPSPRAPTPQLKIPRLQFGGDRGAVTLAPVQSPGGPSLTVAELLRLIASLFVALFAPAHLLARLGGLNARTLGSVARQLERMKARGQALAYEGDDDATIAARIDRAAWIARDPVRALKHMVRRVRGLARLRFAMVAPADFTPPRLACAPLAAPDTNAAPADTS